MSKGYHVGFDGFDPISATAAKDGGAIAVSGYLVGDAAMTPEWVAAVTDAGLGIWSAWELSSAAPENGAAQGRDDSIAATTAAHALGQPKGSAIYYTNDSVVVNWDAVLAYFQAAATITLEAGYVPALYGQTSVWEKVTPFGYGFFWHASDGTEPPYPAQIVQSGKETLSTGEVVDIDEIVASDFGAWNTNGLFPPHVSPTTGDDVQFPTLLPGSTGRLVFVLIAALLSLGYAGGNVADGDPPLVLPANPLDTVYDSAVQFAVIRFRYQHKIEPGDAFGQDCWTKLGELLTAA